MHKTAELTISVFKFQFHAGVSGRDQDLLNLELHTTASEAVQKDESGNAAVSKCRLGRLQVNGELKIQETCYTTCSL